MGKVKSWLGELIGNSGSQIIDSVTNGVDKFVTTDEDRREFELLKGELRLKVDTLAQKAELAYLQDRQSARAMYEKDSSLQKAFALVFLVGYLLMSGLMVWMVIGWLAASQTEVPPWAISLITAVFTAMSTKVNTIVDFLFGGSQGKNDDEREMARQFSQAAKEAQKP